jgi:hypothetical protein
MFGIAGRGSGRSLVLIVATLVGGGLLVGVIAGERPLAVALGASGVTVTVPATWATVPTADYTAEHHDLPTLPAALFDATSTPLSAGSTATVYPSPTP